MARVLFLTRWYPSESKPAKGLFVREHARAASLDNEVVVLHLAGPNDALDRWWRMEQVEDSSLTLGVPTFRVWYRQTRIPGTEYARFLLSGSRALRDLENQTGTWDVIHAHEFDAAFVAVLLRPLHRIPILATEHSSAFSLNTLKDRAIWRARFAFQRCDVVLPVSETVKRAIASHQIRTPLVIVPNAVDLGLFRPLSTIPPNQQWDRRVRRITVVSRLTDAKGLPVLLDACAHLARTRRDWRLDIIGDGSQRPIYEERVRDLKLADRVRFRGLQSRQDVARYLQRADLHVIPSDHETFGVVAVEALACGTPVLATRCGGPEEFINSSIGLLVEPGNAVELASAIDTGLDASFAPRDTISRYAQERFSHEAVGARLSELYEKVHASPRFSRRPTRRREQNRQVTARAG